jgi:hypothetical protein
LFGSGKEKKWEGDSGSGYEQLFGSDKEGQTSPAGGADSNRLLEGKLNQQANIGEGPVIQPPCPHGACFDAASGQLLNPVGAIEHTIFQRLLSKPDPLNPFPYVLLWEVAIALVPRHPNSFQGTVLPLFAANPAAITHPLEYGNFTSIIAGLSTLQQLVATSQGTIFHPEPDKNEREKQAIINRINALILFYDHAQQSEAKPGAKIHEKASLQQLVISLAMSQIGAVRDKELEVDPDFPQDGLVRVGWKRLAEYFATATGDSSWLVDPRVKRPIKGEVLGETKDEHGNKVVKQVPTDDVLPEWCALLPVWAFKSAGLNVGSWPKQGNGSFTNMGFVSLGKNPADLHPGDIGTIDTNNHVFLVVRVNADGDSLTTVDANSAPSGGGTGGQIVLHNSLRRRTDSDSTGFFRANDLLP